jgi:hypothetical protein
VSNLIFRLPSMIIPIKMSWSTLHSGAKLRPIVLFMLVLVAMLAPLTSCGLIDKLSDRPSLNREYVTILVEVYGVPYVNEYIRKEVGEAAAQKYGKVEVISTTGHWKSTYKGDGLWQVQGMIETKKWGDCSTTWTLNESDGQIRLIEFTCD